ncbi:RrF2 family transcriptional regulator [Labilibaculum antarcticum]|uniref:Rrf2 family transcriptional regulator n=1 Tax=Labilibaculum antarcticum TaxID=1717717 RepID=A0A1Y1CHP6_9BACT|nr:Rrf2 family transcriptional regulator [Labilibaculum antarcticum]BAX79899.1 Rrf2 family transcriptional regulator [Labilibaculum antarcticum]
MLSKTAEYAIRALVYIQLQNWEGKRPGFKEIAKNIESPEHFTAKILQILTRFELIKSFKGRNGGFFFDQDSEELQLHRIIVAIDGEKSFTRCSFGLKSCDENNKCPLHDDFSELRNNYAALVKEKTIQTLAKKILNGEAVLTQKVN